MFFQIIGVQGEAGGGDLFLKVKKIADSVLRSEYLTSISTKKKACDFKKESFRGKSF